MAASGARFDLPIVDPESEPWWAAARDGRLLVKRCGACGRAHFYPRPFCPHCWSDDVAWEEVSGRATLYSWSVVHRNDIPPFDGRVPYVAAVVELAEGPRMSTNVVDCLPEELAADMELEVVFRQETEEITVPVFRPRR